MSGHKPMTCRSVALAPASQGPGTPPATPPVTLDLWPHPLTAEGRAVRLRAPPPGEDATLAHLIADAWRAADGTPLPLSALAVDVDGRAIPRADWPALRLRPGSVVTLRPVPAGGDDSDPLRVVLQIAVMAAALVWGGPLGAALGIESAAWAAAVGSTLIMAGGTLIVNALVPPRLPGPAAAGEAPEPVYALAGGANRARPYQPLLLLLGEHRVFPDLAARPYTEFADAADGAADQYLHQIFHFGLGAVDIDWPSLRIGETPLAVFEGVATARTDADIAALVAGNVDTQPGAALEDAAYASRTTSPDTARIGIDIAGSLFEVADDGKPQRRSVTLLIGYQRDGSADPWTSHSVTLAHDSTTPFRRTLTYDLPRPGTWNVRVRRTTDPSADARIRDDLAWAALRAYQRDTASYAGQQRLGLRIRASGQLSGRLDRLSAVCRQRVPTWTGRGWTAPRPSSNPAWIFRWYARGLFVGDRLAAGIGLPPARIDDDAIKRWGAWCDAERLRCDAVIDRPMSHARILTLIAQCGRAAPTWQTGKLGVVWDAANRPATALVTPGNIVAGSLRIDWAAAKGAAEIAVRYIEPDLDWQWNTLRRTVPGATAPGTVATVTLPGVTSARQAAAECNLQAARQVYHRRRIRWEMGPEGLAIQRGDVVHLTHGLLDGGIAGRLAGRDPDDPTVLILDRPVAIAGTAADAPWMMLRLPDGRLETRRVYAGPPTSRDRRDGKTTDRAWTRVPPWRPATTPPTVAYDGDDIDVLWRLYPHDGSVAKVRIVAMEPAADDRIRLEAIDEVPAYYDAATTDLTVDLSTPRPRAPCVIAGAFAETPVRVGQGAAVLLTLSLTVAGDWRGATVRADDGGGGMRTVAVLAAGETEASWLVRANGDVDVVVVPGSDAAPAGPAWRTAYTVTGVRGAVEPPTGFVVSALPDGTRRYAWHALPRYDVIGYRIRHAAAAEDDADDPEWPDMTSLHEGLLTESPWESQEPATGAWRFAIAAERSDGALSAPAYYAATLPAPRGEGPETVPIYTATASATSPPTPAGDTPAGWSFTPASVSAATPYGWISTRRGRTGAWSPWSAPRLWARWGADGDPGPAGARSRGDFFAAAAVTGWSDAAANAATPGGNIVSDTVTLHLAARGWAETRTWDGARWIPADKRIDGNLLVPGTVVADALAAGAVTAREIAAGAVTATRIAAGAVTADKIAAIDISAITGSFRDLAVTGTLSLAQTATGARNAATLIRVTRDGALVGRAWRAFALAESIRSFDSLILSGLGDDRSGWGAASREISVDRVPGPRADAAASVAWRSRNGHTGLLVNVLGSRNLADDVNLFVRASADGQTLYFAENNSNFRLKQIVGLRTPATTNIVSGTSGTANRAPVAAATVTRKDLGSYVEATFDGSGSYDPDGDPLVYRWYSVSQQGKAESLALVASTAIFARTFNRPTTADKSGSIAADTYRFRLTVSDGTHSGSRDVTVTVSPA